jgi:hypothetical protein
MESTATWYSGDVEWKALPHGIQELLIYTSAQRLAFMTDILLFSSAPAGRCWDSIRN